MKRSSCVVLDTLVDRCYEVGFLHVHECDRPAQMSCEAYGHVPSMIVNSQVEQSLPIAEPGSDQDTCSRFLRHRARQLHYILPKKVFAIKVCMNAC